MGQAVIDLEHLRRSLELTVERAEAMALHLAATNAPRSALIEAQDEWSDAVANLAAYLLVTGEPGWIATRTPPLYGGTPGPELRPM